MDSEARSIRTLDRVRIVLVRTSHPGNIGAAARAMKTMGVNKLYLVNPMAVIDDTARAMSSNALDVLEQATVVTSMEEALEGTRLVAALTARRREMTAPPRSAREAVPLIAEATFFIRRSCSGIWQRGFWVV
jgi:tRNA/rRNA methyltransferase